MGLLVDATTAQHARGVGTVIARLIEELPFVAPADTTVVFGPDGVYPPGLSCRRIPMVRTRAGRLVYQRLLLPIDIGLMDRRGQHVDRVLLLDSYIPLVRPQRGVRYASLVHDVLPLTHPHYWPLPMRLAKRSAFSSLRHTNSALFTSTQRNADELRRLTGLRAHVVSFGCGQLSDTEADDALRADLPEQRPYVACVGALQIRKNTLMMITAFEKAVASIPERLSLVLVGDGDRRYVASLRARIASSPLRDRIEIVSDASRERTMHLIAHASALVFPSHAEGFGLPILEALALGTPVVASDIPEIRTWAGDAIGYASPNQPSGWVVAIQTALTANSSQRRSGQLLARGFRWRECASRLLDF